MGKVSDKALAAVFNVLRSGDLLTKYEMAYRAGYSHQTVTDAISVLRRALVGDPLITTKDYRYGFSRDHSLFRDWEAANLNRTVTHEATMRQVDSNARAIGFASQMMSITMPKPLALQSVTAERVENEAA